MYEISKEIKIKNIVIVLLEIPYNQINNENIFCKSLDTSEISWTIERKRSKADNSPYVNIFLNNEKLFAVNYDGWTEEIDINDGKIVGSKFTK
ncbi:MAG TPA: hypothetical protein VLZ75_09285 [Chitinophagales bacterium]|nr:hypothetical protein [Chitinophagales bacterium]